MKFIKVAHKRRPTMSFSAGLPCLFLFALCLLVSSTPSTSLSPPPDSVVFPLNPERGVREALTPPFGTPRHLPLGSPAVYQRIQSRVSARFSPEESKHFDSRPSRTISTSNIALTFIGTVPSQVQQVVTAAVN